MAEAAKKTAAKRTTRKATSVSPMDALAKAIEQARKAGLIVKAIATENTEEGGTTVRF